MIKTSLIQTVTLFNTVKAIYAAPESENVGWIQTELRWNLMPVYTGPERRSGDDRRDYNSSFFKQLFYRGMREAARRAEDRMQIRVFDRYPRSLMIAVITIMSLSLLDAFLTLILISKGATEINPVMNYYLRYGPEVFLLVKYGLTVLSVLLVVIAKEPISSRYCLPGKLLNLFAAFFGGVVIWEIYLLLFF